MHMRNAINKKLTYNSIDVGVIEVPVLLFNARTSEHYFLLQYYGYMTGYRLLLRRAGVE